MEKRIGIETDRVVADFAQGIEERNQKYGLDEFLERVDNTEIAGNTAEVKRLCEEFAERVKNIDTLGLGYAAQAYTRAKEWGKAKELWERLEQELEKKGNHNDAARARAWIDNIEKTQGSN